MNVLRFYCKFLVVTVLSFWLVSSTFSQIPKADRKWWKDEKIRQQLQLSPQQVKQLDEIMDAFRTRLSAIAQELEVKRKEREQLAKSSGMNTAAYRELTHQLYTLKESLDKLHLTFRIRLGEVLSAQQKATLRKLQSAKKPN